MKHYVKRALFAPILILTLSATAFAGEKAGNGTPDEDYARYLKTFEDMLPDCTSPNPPGGANAPDSLESQMTNWMNKISLVLKQSEDDAESDRYARPEVAYLHMKAALEAIIVKTEGCRDLRSLLSRPIADATFKAIKSMEATASTTDGFSTGDSLYYFARGSVRTTNEAATLVDLPYFGPFSNHWDPEYGFDRVEGGNRRYLERLPHRHHDLFARRMLDVVAHVMRLIDRLGAPNERGRFTPYYVLLKSFLPVAQVLTEEAQKYLKTNLLILSRLEAYNELEILKNRIKGYMTGNSSENPSFPVIVFDVHTRAMRIASLLENSRFDFRNF